MYLFYQQNYGDRHEEIKSIIARFIPVSNSLLQANQDYSQIVYIYVNGQVFIEEWKKLLR